MSYKHLVVGGCSFSETHHPWAYELGINHHNVSNLARRARLLYVKIFNNIIIFIYIIKNETYHLFLVGVVNRVGNNNNLIRP